MRKKMSFGSTGHPPKSHQTKLKNRYNQTNILCNLLKVVLADCDDVVEMNFIIKKIRNASPSFRSRTTAKGNNVSDVDKCNFISARAFVWSFRVHYIFWLLLVSSGNGWASNIILFVHVTPFPKQLVSDLGMGKQKPETTNKCWQWMKVTIPSESLTSGILLQLLIATAKSGRHETDISYIAHNYNVSEQQ